jgi:hypothetical protein
VETDGQLDQVKTRRLITFFDTRQQHLNRSQYIFRERIEVDGGERQLTLKYRHPDRYVAQSRNMDARGGEDAKTKFEEDIKVPFVPLYSFSTTIGIGDQKIDALDDIARLFPDIVESVPGFQREKPLATVNGFTTREVVLTGGTLQIGKTPKVDAECALIVWYEERARKHTKPVVVELSYRYGSKDENYSGGSARRAFEVFRLLQTKLGKWIDPKPRTKTSFVYE